VIDGPFLGLAYEAVSEWERLSVPQRPARDSSLWRLLLTFGSLHGPRERCVGVVDLEGRRTELSQLAEATSKCPTLRQTKCGPTMDNAGFKFRCSGFRTHSLEYSDHRGGSSFFEGTSNVRPVVVLSNAGRPQEVSSAS
jgi:hypothetical protein